MYACLLALVRADVLSYAHGLCIWVTRAREHAQRTGCERALRLKTKQLSTATANNRFKQFQSCALCTHSTHSHIVLNSIKMLLCRPHRSEIIYYTWPTYTCTCPSYWDFLILLPVPGPVCMCVCVYARHLSIRIRHCAPLPLLLLLLLMFGKQELTRFGQRGFTVQRSSAKCILTHCILCVTRHNSTDTARHRHRRHNDINTHTRQLISCRQLW